MYERLALGRNGSKVVKSSDGVVAISNASGQRVGIVKAISDCVFSAITDRKATGSSLVGETLKAGDCIYGDFSGNFGLTSGVAILYYV